MQVALLAFNDHWAAVEQELRHEIFKQSEGEQVVRADVERLPYSLMAVKIAMAEMIVDGEQLFSHLRQNQPEVAGRRMATMDRKYAK
jgi:hypothetical protein